MPDKCEHLEQCGFFRCFTNNLEVIKQGWIKLYCEDKETSELCERKKVTMQTGKSPADNMAPTGTFM